MNEEYNEQQNVEPVETVETPASAPQEKKVDIGGWLKYAWDLFVTDVVKFMVAALIVLVISAVTCLILSGPMMVGFFKCILKKMRGEDFEYGELFDGVRNQFLPAFLVSLAGYVLIGITQILNIIPVVGFVAAFICQLIVMLLLSYIYLQIAEAEETVPIEKTIDMGKALIEKIKPEIGMFIVWSLVVSIIGGLGVIACCVGIFATNAIAMIATAKSYVDAIKDETEATVIAEEVVVE